VRAFVNESVEEKHSAGRTEEQLLGGIVGLQQMTIKTYVVQILVRAYSEACYENSMWFVCRGVYDSRVVSLL
jgi:hypothetical protein